jgi:hypothetical protein
VAGVAARRIKEFVTLSFILFSVLIKILKQTAKYFQIAKISAIDKNTSGIVLKLLLKFS